MTALTVKEVSEERRVSFSIFNPAFQQSDDHCNNAHDQNYDNADHDSDDHHGNYDDNNADLDDNYEQNAGDNYDVTCDHGVLWFNKFDNHDNDDDDDDDDKSGMAGRVTADICGRGAARTK